MIIDLQLIFTFAAMNGVKQKILFMLYFCFRFAFSDLHSKQDFSTDHSVHCCQTQIIIITVDKYF